MIATLFKFCFGTFLYVLSSLAFPQTSVDCFPDCSERQIGSAKRYLESEISVLVKKYQRYESKVNMLENDILFVRFNIRRAQIGSVVKSTSTSVGGSQFTSWGSPAELKVLTEKLEKLEGSMFELEIEKRRLFAQQNDFATLVPENNVES